MVNPRTTADPSEAFTGAEIDPATDLKEAEGDAADMPDDAAAATMGGDEIGGAAAVGDALATALERDVLGMGDGANWGPDQGEEFDEAATMGAAVSDILSAEWTSEQKESALEDLMSEQGKGIVEATQHLTGMLTGTDSGQTAGENRANEAEQNDATSTVASEVGRVSHTAAGAATMLVNGLRTNVGISAVSSATSGIVNYA